jgi:hypothetical protein
MSRWPYLLLLVVMAGLIGVVAVSRFGSSGSHTSFAQLVTPTETHTPGPTPNLTPSPTPGVLHASIDADPDNGSGPCNPIDTRGTGYIGLSYDVAICLESMPKELGAFSFLVNYDGGMSSCTDIACPTGDCLDDNPDANAGTTSFGPTNLGAGWDCNPVDLMEPTCHWSILNWNAAGISCWNLIGPYTTPVGDVAFPLAVINLNAIAQGTDHLTLASVLLTSTDAIDMGDIGSCNPVSSAEIPCYGAEIVLIAVGTI